MIDKIRPRSSPAGRFAVFAHGCDAAFFDPIMREEGFSIVVLGHHHDDLLETFFLNLFHGGRRATMPPRLLIEDGDLHVARPLALVAEADCEQFARAMAYPIITCGLCRSQDGLQRAEIKRLLDNWGNRSPGRRQVMFRALMNVRPSHLADPALFDFARLAASFVEPEEDRENSLQLLAER